MPNITKIKDEKGVVHNISLSSEVKDDVISAIGNASDSTDGFLSAEDFQRIGTLEDQVASIETRTDVVDIVATKADLDNYDTSTLSANDIIKVLNDETHSDKVSYYRLAANSTWTFVGSVDGYYTKGEADTLLTAHTNNTNNPHSVTASQVGLGNVVNTGDSATPVQNGTTKFTTGGAYTLKTNLETAITNHTTNQSNPHSVTKAQVGLGNVDDKSEATIKSDFTGSIANNNTGFVTGNDVYAHTSNTSNPHNVTASQIGLGNVDNTGDSATPVQFGITKFTTGGAYTLKTTLETSIGTKQDALTTQTAYTSKGSTYKVPVISTNSLGQVTSISEENISTASITDTSGSESISVSTSASSTKTLNVVTRDTPQTISGTKTFTSNVIINPGTLTLYNNSDPMPLSINASVGSGAAKITKASGSGSIDLQLGGSGRLLDVVGTYGLKMPSTFNWTADKTIATTDDIPTNYITTDTAQEVTASKDFQDGIETNGIGIYSEGSNYKIGIATDNGPYLYLFATGSGGFTASRTIYLPDINDPDEETLATIEGVSRNYVNLSGTQNISGSKTFQNYVITKRGAGGSDAESQHIGGIKFSGVSGYDSKTTTLTATPGTSNNYNIYLPAASGTVLLQEDIKETIALGTSSAFSSNILLTTVSNTAVPQFPSLNLYSGDIRVSNGINGIILTVGSTASYQYNYPAKSGYLVTVPSITDEVSTKTKTTITSGTHAFDSTGEVSLPYSLFTNNGTTSGTFISGLYLFTYGNAQAFVYLDSTMLANEVPIRAPMPAVYQGSSSIESRPANIKIWKSSNDLKVMVSNGVQHAGEGFKITVIRSNLI